MDVDSLRVFIEVMQRGSFAAVARRMDVDPSSVSRTVQSLEAELGYRLFQRTTRKLAPTEAGALYYERVLPLVEELERARHEAADVVAEPSGTLRVTASVAFGQMCLVPLLGELRERYPELALDLVLTDTNVDLIAERIDVALRLGARMDPGLIGTKLMPTRYHVVASPAWIDSHGAPKRPAALADVECLRFPFSGFGREWRFRDGRKRESRVRIGGGVVASSALALRQAALDGIGPALLADWLVGADLAAGRLVDLFPRYRASAGEFDTAAWILYPSRAYLPLKVRAFIDFLKARYAD